MRFCTIILLTVLTSNFCLAQITLSADGPGNTYSLINGVLAPGHNAIEVPDCGHTTFGEHIDEIFDADLNTNVFRFISHVAQDDDRCINFDRQRCEIKTYDKSPANLLAVENESVQYTWKFKLPLGFQTSSNFTHLHQLKSVDDPFDSMPMYTLTARKGNPDKLELRYAEFGNSTKIDQIDLAPLLGNWVSVTENISYSNPGIYAIEIRKVSDNSVIMSYSDSSVNNWRVGAIFIRPKWGVYRSLNNAQDLRDEEVLFNDFGIEELAAPLSTKDDAEISKLKVFPNPAFEIIQVMNLPYWSTNLKIYAATGQKLLTIDVNSENETIDISSLASGTYIIKVNGLSNSITRTFNIANH